MRWKLLAAAAACAVLPGAGQAASVTITDFTTAGYNAELGTLGMTVVEDFESYGVGNVISGPSPDPGFDTNVGTFTTLGGTGSGGTVTDPEPDLDGTKLAIREGTVYGRSSTTDDLTGNEAFDQFLDSNDTWGMAWAVDIGRMFDKIIFTLTDATDVGATITVSADGTTPEVFSGQTNANQKLVVVDFGFAVSDAMIMLSNTKNGQPVINDGFSVDDIAVSVVPLPASALLLLGGLGGLAALRRRRTAA